MGIVTARALRVAFRTALRQGLIGPIIHLLGLALAVQVLGQTSVALARGSSYFPLICYRKWRFPIVVLRRNESVYHG